MEKSSFLALKAIWSHLFTTHAFSLPYMLLHLRKQRSHSCCKRVCVVSQQKDFFYTCKPENRNQASGHMYRPWFGRHFLLWRNFNWNLISLDFQETSMCAKINSPALRWQQHCRFAWLDKQLCVHQKYFVDCIKPGEVTHLWWSTHQWRKKVLSAAAGLNHQVLAGCRGHVAGQIIRCWPVTEGCSHSKNVQDSSLTLPSFPKAKTTVSLMNL